MYQDYDEHNAGLRKRLIGALIGLARPTDGDEYLINDSATAALIDGLLAIRENPRADDGVLEELLKRVGQEKRKMVPDCFLCACPCGKNDDYDVDELDKLPDEIRELKLELLSGLQDLAHKARQFPERLRQDRAVDRFLYKGLIVMGMDWYGEDDLQAVLRELEQIGTGR